MCSTQEKPSRVGHLINENKKSEIGEPLPDLGICRFLFPQRKKTKQKWVVFLLETYLQSKQVSGRCRKGSRACARCAGWLGMLVKSPLCHYDKLIIVENIIL